MKATLFRTLGYIFLGAFVLGTLSRIMHWPLASEIRFTGSIGAGISFLLYYSLKPNQSFYDRAAMVLAPVVLTVLILRSVHADYQMIYLSVALVISLAFLIYSLWQAHRKEQMKFSDLRTIKLSEINWERALYMIGAVVVIIGIIMKYNHTPKASLFLIVGLSILALSYIVGLFSKKGLED